MKKPQFWIGKYEMQKHPEGGYFAETYRSKEKIAKSGLPERFKGDRSFSTGIYFLLESHHISAFHKIESDEMWHFYTGSPLDIYVISPEGVLDVIKLGENFENNEVFQAVVPAGSWFGSKPAVKDSYSLVGCTVAPGFDFDDFEMKSRKELIAMFPQHAEIIEILTY
ncbi:hypothetical protein SAMN04515674_103124 [Pseudarcicella hirudinis]|uniref:DUF985 domain-containing protein n=1 Tax=Pseudarcicella hirudinis TaxID=1079859 RepID=A0A1I5QCB3_9BACT|nr:cupin domain-containing protein [Pseudarcicella hirudinis]SFP43949.1 hypothetical protein SAMN04515674_103124 [Pseudarcicella hirudinis]